MNARPTALLDVNVLVALFDPMHVHHECAHRWLGDRHGAPWASCPLTENGFCRVVASPSYPGRRTTVADAIDRLRRFREASTHEFWDATVSVCDGHGINAASITGHRQVTDVYLLALAVRRQGVLATFDSRIPIAAVHEATPGHLAVLTDSPAAHGG